MDEIIENKLKSCTNRKSKDTEHTYSFSFEQGVLRSTCTQYKCIQTELSKIN